MERALDRKSKRLNHQKALRGGKLNEADFGSRMRGEGAFGGRGIRWISFRSNFVEWEGGTDLETPHVKNSF